MHKVPTRWWNWWPLLIGPAGMVYSYIVIVNGQPQLAYKPYLEIIAIGVVYAAAACSLLHLFVSRHPYYLLLSCVAIVVVLREHHWDWTTHFVYGALVAIAIWGALWWKRLAPYLDLHPPVRVWLICTAITYFLSQCIARRAFEQVMPNEELVYDHMEEVVENLSHIMLIVSALVGPWASRRAAAA
jgi:hypothetical protein